MQYERLVILIISIILSSVVSINAKKITQIQTIFTSNIVEGQTRNVIEGDLSSYLVVQPASGTLSWITLKLSNFAVINRVIVKRRLCCEDHMAIFSVSIGDSFCQSDPKSFQPSTQDSLCYSYNYGSTSNVPESVNETCSTSLHSRPPLGNYVTIFKNSPSRNIHLAEIEIYGEILSDITPLKENYVYEKNGTRGYILKREKNSFWNAKKKCEDDNSYLAINSGSFLASYLRREISENKFWRNGHYFDNKWYTASDCSQELSSLPNAVNSPTNDMKMYWDRDLKLYGENPNQQFYYICERDLPNSVSNCPDYCEYCEIFNRNNMDSRCICENGKYGVRCQWPCSGNFYGVDCNIACGNCRGGSACNSETGLCSGGCENGWTGDKCNEAVTTESTIESTVITTKLTSTIRPSTLAPTKPSNNSFNSTIGDGPTDKNKIGLIIGVVLASVVLFIAIVVGVVFCYRMRTNGKAHPEADIEENISVKEDQLETASDHVPSVNNDSIIKNRNSTINDRVSAAYENTQHSIKVENLGSVIERLSKDDQKGFQNEFSELPNGQIHEWNDALRADVRSTKKNRYKNIFAYDKTRVEIETDDGTDYINANYISGYNKKQTFIASQGPTDNMVNDFWKMIWEHKIPVIIMVTNLYENGTTKCVQYWANKEEERPKNFGPISVQCIGEKEYLDYKIRNLQAYKGEESKKVKLYHFTGWPDFGVPSSPSSLLNFIQTIRNDKRLHDKTAVIHCSAGVGRTGTFIALHTLMQSIEETGSLNVFHTVLSLRQERVAMVQKEEQYAFIYKALHEYVQCGRTTFSVNKFLKNLPRLKENPPGFSESRIERQYEMLSAQKVKLTVSICHLGIENRELNRNQDILPIDQFRPELSPLDGRNTYINAIYVPNFEKSKFVVTQMPIQSTRIDLWRLADQCKCNVIVMLNPLDEDNDLDFPYWPGESEALVRELAPYKIENDKLSLSLDLENEHIVVTQLLLSKSTDKTTRVPKIIRHVRLTNWTDKNEVPPDMTTFIDLFEIVRKLNMDSTKHKRILIHCL
ncbi:DgyrCDS4493 [Dimorphilus gyrociliatus]|nr:DgyrCDS4493 [Dimorphilus gyrociliatus]